MRKIIRWFFGNYEFKDPEYLKFSRNMVTALISFGLPYFLITIIFVVFDLIPDIGEIPVVSLFWLIITFAYLSVTGACLAALIIILSVDKYESKKRREKMLAEKVKQPSFEEMLEAQFVNNGRLFDSKREKFLIGTGKYFACYACTHAKPIDSRVRFRGQDYCPECYERVKGEPRLKDKGEE